MADRATQPSQPPRRSGAPAPASQRALRIGLVLGKEIVEEKLIRERTEITIGQSLKNTIHVPVHGLPRSWPLFRAEGGRYVLRFNEAMDGRVADGSGPAWPVSCAWYSARRRRSSSRFGNMKNTSAAPRTTATMPAR